MRSLSLLLIVLATALGSCTGTPAKEQPALVLVPISDFKSVAGKWEGMAKKGPDMQDEAWIILTIQENGTFTFSGVRETGLLAGAAALTLQDGRLASHTERRNAVFTLYEKNGHPVLVAEATGKDGQWRQAELTRAK
jgi:hypothetical protein